MSDDIRDSLQAKYVLGVTAAIMVALIAWLVYVQAAKSQAYREFMTPVEDLAVQPVLTDATTAKAIAELKLVPQDAIQVTGAGRCPEDLTYFRTILGIFSGSPVCPFPFMKRTVDKESWGIQRIVFSAQIPEDQDRGQFEFPGSVSVVHGASREPCAFDAQRARFVCGGVDWHAVHKRAIKYQGLVRRCLYVHPRQGVETWLAFGTLKAGSRIRGALYWTPDALQAKAAAVLVRFHAADNEFTAITMQPQVPRTPFEVEMPASPPGAMLPVALAYQTSADANRQTCLSVDPPVTP